MAGCQVPESADSGPAECKARRLGSAVDALGAAIGSSLWRGQFRPRPVGVIEFADRLAELRARRG